MHRPEGGFVTRTEFLIPGVAGAGGNAGVTGGGVGDIANACRFARALFLLRQRA